MEVEFATDEQRYSKEAITCAIVCAAVIWIV